MKQYFEEKRIRPDILTAAVFWAVIIMMLYEIVCLGIYGDRGAGFASGPVLIFYILYLAFVLAVQKAVWVMVRIRARRSQYLNAETNMQRSFKIFVFLGTCIMVLLLIGSFTFSDFLFGTNRGMFQCIIIAVCSLLLCIQGVLRGYLQGIGYTRPIIVSDLLIAITSFISGTVISFFMYSYGVKVNSLFHISEFSAVYGSVGMLLGILIGSLVGLIHIIISFSLRKNEIAEIVRQGAPRYLDNKNDVIASIKAIMLLYVTPALLVLFDQIFYVVSQRNVGTDEDAALYFGIYSGRVLPFLVIFILLCCVPFIKPWNRVMARIERDEFEGARERLGALIHSSSCLTLPATVFVFIMAETLETAVFGKNNELADMLIQIGSVMILLGAAAVFLSWLFNHMGKSLLTTICLAASWGVHIILLAVFELVLKLGIYGVLFATIAAALIYDLLSAILLNKMLRYRQEIVRTFIIPLLSSAAAGLVCFILNRLFINIIGDILTLLVCVSAFYIVYLFAMTFLKGLSSSELKRVPLGKLFERLRPTGSHENYED